MYSLLLLHLKHFYLVSVKYEKYIKASLIIYPKMTSKIITAFTTKVDIAKDDYTLDELKKLLTESFKESKTKKRNTTGEKKEPSKYNIFIKEEIQRIRTENPNTDNKQLMSIAASRWKEHKEKIAATTA